MTVDEAINSLSRPNKGWTTYALHDFEAKQIAALLQQQQQQIEQQTAGIATMETALKIIAYPMNYLQDYAELQGAKLDVMWAMQIIKEPDWYQCKAKEALSVSKQQAQIVAELRGE